MPIIKSKTTAKKEKIKLEINKDIFDEIVSYMKWADISDLNFFFEESSTFLFSKDKEWKSQKKKAVEVLK